MLLTTTSSAVRPLGKLKVAVRTKGGRLVGARFWKNGGCVIPLTNLFSAMGRSRTPSTAPGATAW